MEVNKVDNSKRNVYIASKYDVYKEAQVFALNHSFNLKQINILYGLGLGYHVKELTQNFYVQIKTIVFDLRIDIFEFGKSRNLYKRLEKSTNVLIIVNDNERILDAIKHYSSDEAYFFTHTPSIKAISDYNDNFRFILEKN